MLEVKITKTVSTKKRSFTLNADFAIDQQKSTTVFFGASGSGKTMTLQCLAGLLKPDSGHIKFDDRTLFDSKNKINLTPQKRRIGYMPQDFGLFPHLTLLENVAYPNSGITGKFLNSLQKEKARKLIRDFDLEGMENSIPGQLSGGQKQRAALARALNANPFLLLLDEPFSSLDPLLRTQMRSQLQKFLKSLSLPLIVITHDPDDAEVFGQNIILFAAGKTKTFYDLPQIRKNYSSMTECLISLQAMAKAEKQNRGADNA